ncbi:hypothetical protein PIROE2DRAFT_16764 [Piromyces sp. E2]|nr:hypothetical protein PIROE2DRAFT_16764 [Piromyces sp. E2]|eukprot:OUM58063.1 hypothetical protein PIROE2DRAFT_16764 [Piromyces sp. E2]
MKYIFFIVFVSIITVSSSSNLYGSNSQDINTCIKIINQRTVECEVDKGFTQQNREKKCTNFYDKCYDVYNKKYDSIPECQKVDPEEIDLIFRQSVNRDYYRGQHVFFCTKTETNGDYCVTDISDQEHIFSYERMCPIKNCYEAALTFANIALDNEEFIKLKIDNSKFFLRMVEMFKSDECKNGTLKDDVLWDIFEKVEADAEKEEETNTNSNNENISKNNTLIYIGIAVGVLGSSVFIIINIININKRKASKNNLNNRDITISFNNNEQNDNNNNNNTNNASIRNINESVSYDSKQNLILNNNSQETLPPSSPTINNTNTVEPAQQQNQFPVISATLPGTQTPQLFVLQPLLPNTTANLSYSSVQSMVPIHHININGNDNINPPLPSELPTYDQAMENGLNILTAPTAPMAPATPVSTIVPVTPVIPIAPVAPTASSPMNNNKSNTDL